MFQTSVDIFLEFLFELYDSGLGYSVLNTARSAVSSILKIDNLPAGEHSMVKRFVKGVFNSRPSLPRYNCIWDTSPVLKKLEKFHPANTLSLKLLTFKVLLLLALLTSQRTQNLQSLRLKDITLNNENIQIVWSSLMKQSRPGYNLEPVVLQAFVQNKKLCIVSYLRQYISRTKYIRGDNEQLFVSYKEPHDSVSKSTVSRWLRTIMSMCGVDTDKFKPHSTRSASVSKAIKFAPMDVVLKAAGWSKESTFAKFYNKPIRNEHYMNKVLQQISNETG